MQVSLTIKDDNGRRVMSIASVAPDARGVAAMLYGAARSIDATGGIALRPDDGKLHGRAIADAAVAAMWEHGAQQFNWRPKALLSAIEMLGHSVAGVDPEATMITALHRDPRIHIVSKGVYALGNGVPDPNPDPVEVEA